MDESLHATKNSPEQPQAQRSISELQSPFVVTREEQEAQTEARKRYLEYMGKDPMKALFMRSIRDPSHGIQLDPANPFEKVILALMDAPAIQRMKYISQLSTASWVYPDAVHSRFPHIVGSAELAAEIINHLYARANSQLRQQFLEWGPVCVAFAMTHDLGHISPGSHVAHRVWFDGQPDRHEEMSHMLLKKDHGLRYALEHTLGVGGAKQLDLVVAEDPSVPPWTWQLITAGGWNVDRGDWVPRDSIMCGTTYGMYDTPIIKKNLLITSTGDLAIHESGVSTLEAFFSARFDMYRNVYRHPTCRIGEIMHALVGRRARELFGEGKLTFSDDTMEAVLSVMDGTSLDVPAIMNMTEHWWLYHLGQWSNSDDPTLSILSRKVLRREPFKHCNNDSINAEELRDCAKRQGFDSEYFVLSVPPSVVKLEKDLKTALKVCRTDGSIVSIVDYSPLMKSFNELGSLEVQGFVAAPQEAFAGIRIN